MDGEQEDVEGWEEGDDDVHMTDEGETSGSGLGSRMRDLGRPALHLPLVVCTAMRQNTVSVLAPKRLERGCLGGLRHPRISSQARKTNRTASKILSPRQSAFLPAMPVLSLISRQPLGKTQKNKELT